jgi:hypothetical protein
LKRIVALLGVLALTTAAFSSLAQAGRSFMVTGGGQTAVGTSGPGDTIAFTARDTDADAGDAAQGQVQFVDREAGQIVEVYHGTVTCLVPASGGSDGAAYFAGQWTNQGAGDFEIYVADNGEPNQGNDMIFIDQEDGFNCSDDNDDDEPTALGRGNVQYHAAN